MATIVMRLDKRAEKNGQYKVRIRISHNGTSSWIATGVYIEERYFNEDSIYEPISKRAFMYEEKREQLLAIVRKFDEVVFALKRDEVANLDEMSANDLREYIVGRKTTKKKEVKKKPSGMSFLNFFEQYGDSRASVNTKKHYSYVLRLLTSYCMERGVMDIQIKDIDYLRMIDIAKWVTDGGRSDVTRYKVESYIRAAYREAQRMKLVSRDDDPFFDYKIKSVQERDEVDVMSVETLRKLLSLDLSNQQGFAGLTKARDILMISFYLCGANLIDIFTMQKQDGEDVAFVRHKIQGKTKRATRIFIEPELRKLMDKYSGDNLMFRFAEDVPNYYTFQRRLNDRCERLSLLIGEQVNMQLIRRTWATIAGELEAPDRVIDKSMGHKDASVKDIHYEKYDWERTRKWNRKVIDYVMDGVAIDSVKCQKIFRKK